MSDPTTLLGRFEEHLGIINFHSELQHPFDEQAIAVAQCFEVVSALGFILRRGVRLQISSARCDYAFSGAFNFTGGCLHLMPLSDTIPIYALNGAILRGITNFKQWVEVDTTEPVRHAVRHARKHVAPKKRHSSRTKRNKHSGIINLSFKITYPFDVTDIAIGTAFQLTGPCGSALARGVRIQQSPGLNDFYYVGKSRAVCVGQPLDLLPIPPCEPLYKCEAVCRGLTIEPIVNAEFNNWVSHVPHGVLTHSISKTTKKRLPKPCSAVPLSDTCLIPHVPLPLSHEDDIPHCYPPKRFRCRLALELTRKFLRSKFPGEKI